MSKQDVTNPIPGAIYLHKVRFNSKTITWQPCVFVEETADGRWKVEDLDTMGRVYTVQPKSTTRIASSKRGADGKWEYEQVVESTLRFATAAWQKTELKKAADKIAAAQERYKLILSMESA